MRKFLYEAALMGAAGLIMLAFLMLWDRAHAQSFGYVQPGQGFVITPGVPTVPGIRDRGAPIGYGFPSLPEPPRPNARIRELWAPAPANGCTRPAFEVISGPPAQRGCYGSP